MILSRCFRCFIGFGAFDGFGALSDFGGLLTVIGDSVVESVGSAIIGDWVGKSVGDSVVGDSVGGTVLLQKAASYAALLNKAQPESFWGKYPIILNVGLTDSSSPVQV